MQSTVKRLQNIIEDDKIICITNIKHANDVKFQLRQIDSKGKVIAEPMGKNTAPAIACAVEYISRAANGSDEEILVLPSDHLIKDIKAFENTVKTAQKAAREGYLVTFGIKPLYPETGYGYIKTANSFENEYKVEKFVEKPDAPTAK